MSKFTRIFLFACVAAFSASESHAGFKYQYTTVKRYYPSNTTVFMIPDVAIINPAGCERANYYVFNSAHPNYEDYKKLILSAKVSGLKLGLYIHDDRCQGGYPELHRMFIQ